MALAQTETSVEAARELLGGVGLQAVPDGMTETGDGEVIAEDEEVTSAVE